MEMDTKQQMKNAALHLETIFSSAIDAMVVTDAHGVIQVFNAAAEQMFGYRSEEVVGLNVRILMPMPDSLNHHLYMERYLETHQSHIPRKGREVIALHRNGESFFVDIAISDVLLEGEVIFTAVLRDISARKNKEQRIIRLAFFDQETGLPNSYYLSDRLERLLKEQETGNYLISLFLGELSNYVNIFGIRGIKEVIVTLAQLLNEKLPARSLVVRCGIRQLKIIYVAKDSETNAKQIAEELQSYLSLPLSIEEQHIFLTASFGITAIVPEQHNVNSLLDCADIALHIARNSVGKNYAVFKQEFEHTLHRRAMIVQKLHNAMANKPFELYLQPQINLKSQKIIGVEALIRWQDGIGEWLSPAEFIPIAETIGLILDITLWTLKVACNILNDWQKNNQLCYPIAVNISAPILCFPSFVREISTILAEKNINPRYIELEITETALMLNLDSAIKTVNELSAQGISIAIDDFGTGLSSLSYLKDFKINRLKIDKSFIDHVQSNNNDRIIIEAIVKFGHELGYQVICEGVEHRDQFALLTQIGCDEAQGYYIAKPMPAEEFLEFAENFAGLPHGLILV